MTLEIGVYTFGNTPQAGGRSRSDRAADDGSATAQAVRDALEAARLADEVGLDFFGFGEHHTPSMPLSSPTSMVVAAAATTRRIRLGTTVTVLSTEEPLRVFQQLATAAAVAPGRVEAVAGRGSSSITFPLFDADESDYDLLFESKLDLLQHVMAHDRASWFGPHRRRPLAEALVVPRPEIPLKLWLGTGGSPASVARAAARGLPMFLGVLGGTPDHWARYGHAYRAAWTEAGHPVADAEVAVAVHGFLGDDDRSARATYLDHELRMFATGAVETGRRPQPPSGRDADLRSGMVFAGGPDEVADRTLDLHQRLGHTRQILQMDVGGMPHATYLRSIELLGTEVLPQIRKELG